MGPEKVQEIKDVIRRQLGIPETYAIEIISDGQTGSAITPDNRIAIKVVLNSLNQKVKLVIDFDFPQAGGLGSGQAGFTKEQFLKILNDLSKIMGDYPDHSIWFSGQIRDKNEVVLILQPQGGIKKFKEDLVLFFGSPGNLKDRKITRASSYRGGNKFGVTLIESDDLAFEVGITGSNLYDKSTDEEFQVDRFETINEKPGSASDNAVLSAAVPGGIDFNANNLNLSTRGDEIKLNIPADLQGLEPAAVDGVTPIIINIVPIVNFPLLLGVSQPGHPDQLSRL